MNIFIKNAYSNNLKNISVTIPTNKITAITGVSGSGKSTLLKNVIAAYGSDCFTRLSSKTIRDALLINKNIDVEKISNLPPTILIDPKVFVNNITSTVSTLTGIHDNLRSIFAEFGEAHCGYCAHKMIKDFSALDHLFIDLKIDDQLNDAVNYLNANGKIIEINYFDSEGKPTETLKQRKFCTIEFILKKINEQLLQKICNEFQTRVYTYAAISKIKYDVLRETECPICHKIGPNLIRSRFSFNVRYEDGGGACRYCEGLGKVLFIDEADLISDPSKPLLKGASNLINEKGIKYTTITEKCLLEVYRVLNLNIDSPISEIPYDKLHKILYGFDKNISYLDRVGGKKTIKYEGISNYLITRFKKNKQILALKKICKSIKCEHCDETRIDDTLSNILFQGKSIINVLNMSLSELGEWCSSISNNVPKEALMYIQKILMEINSFNSLCCGHLKLNRASSTLSGGELQRIRICTMFNSKVHGLCYLLDEPSCGLHMQDIKQLGSFLSEISSLGNTIIIVEHNKELLKYCDYIVDMGPLGGEQGGYILMADEFCNISKYNTDTSKSLLCTENIVCDKNNYTFTESDFLEFHHLSYNNLKNISVKFPKQAFSIVCGVSGSGKSTFIKKAVYDTVSLNPLSYGFDDISFISQNASRPTKSSNVSTILNINMYISKLYEKQSGKDKSYFNKGSSHGKCIECKGTGYVFSDENEIVGICEKCKGKGFSNDTLKVKIDGLNIYELYSKSFNELMNIVSDEKIRKVVIAGCKLGVGYLTLSRNAKSLSKGELQRVSLIPALISQQKQLIILDEPSKGLHAKDIGNLIDALHQVIKNGNTLLVVEHNLTMIRNADYVIELGGAGVDGGHLLYQGSPNGLTNTPTAIALNEYYFEKTKIEKRKHSDIIINENNQKLNYSPFNIYIEKQHGCILEKIGKQSIDDFLSVAIPNNYLFTKKGIGNNENDIPVIFTVDFKQKTAINRSISEVVGIHKIIQEIISQENENLLKKYILNPNSSTGKCSICNGKGVVYSIPTEFFLKNGDLSPTCKKFLRNITNYNIISKVLKKDRINIQQKMEGMTDEEKRILFWGLDKKYEIDGEVIIWKGIVNNFMQYHKYYSEKDAEKVYSKRIKTSCPICNGNRLKYEYKDYDFFKMSYKEWMDLSITKILKHFSHVAVLNESFNIIVKILKLLQTMGLGEYRLSDEISILNHLQVGKLKIITLNYNRIYGLGIIIKNIELLDEEDRTFIMHLIEEWKDTSTIWII